jgi:hypothetical protein
MEEPRVTRLCCASLLLLVLLGGCTEKEPLYCDRDTRCTQPGYSCDYEHRRCVQKQDASPQDSGQPDNGSNDSSQPDTVAMEVWLPDQMPADQGEPDAIDISLAE